MILFFATVSASGADWVYFVQRQVSKTGKPASGGMSAFETAPGGTRGANTRIKPVSTVSYRVMRTDRNGGTARVLLETDQNPVAISSTADGRVVCHLEGISGNGAEGAPAVTTEVVIISATGTVERRIDLGGLGVRVIGTAVLLPDGKHLGLTVCKAPDRADLQHGLANPQGLPQTAGPHASDPRPTGPHPTDPQSAQQQLSQLHGSTDAARIGGGGGIFPDQPYVATVDLSGKDLRKIGPGAMPRWSPDGKTILFTALTVSGMYATPVGPRLSVMDADGGAVRPVAEEGSWDGSFSGDGKRIVYVSGGPSGTRLMTANADGSGAVAVKLPSSIYASPRFVGEGRTIEFASRVEAAAKAGAPSGTSAGAGSFKAVWVVTVDGVGLKRSSPVPSQLNPHGSGIDEHAERLTLNLTMPQTNTPAGVGSAPPGPHGAPDDPPMPGTGPAGTRPIPPGYTVESRGTMVYFRDPGGRFKMIPDGNYEMPDGTVMRIRGGRRLP